MHYITSAPAPRSYRALQPTAPPLALCSLPLRARHGDLGDLQAFVTSLIYRLRREFRIVTHQHMKTHKHAYRIACCMTDPVLIPLTVFWFGYPLYDTSIILWSLLCVTLLINVFMPLFPDWPLALLRRALNMACNYSAIILSFHENKPTFAVECAVMLVHLCTVFSHPSHLDQLNYKAEHELDEEEQGRRRKLVERNTIFFLLQFVLHGMYSVTAVQTINLAGGSGSPSFWLFFVPAFALRFILQSRNFIAGISECAVEPRLDMALCVFGFVDTFWGQMGRWFRDEPEPEGARTGDAFHHDANHDQ
jgi:hypothetical protein